MSSYESLGIDPVTVTVIGYGVAYASKFISSLIIARNNAEAQKALAKDQAERERIQAEIDKMNQQIDEIQKYIDSQKSKQEGIRASSALAVAGSALLGLILITQ
jgi:peptidoglycan hydrolase CwlO-like protein